MIALESDYCPDITGLIIIDCWEPASPNKRFLDQFYLNLVDILKKFNFSCVINASTNCRLDLSDPSQQNVMRIYNWRYHPSQFDKRDNEIVANLVHQGQHDQHTSVIIKKFFLENKHSFAINTIEDFKYHNSKHLNNTCNNWLVVGQTWQMCTHYNDISLTNLPRRVKDMNFYTVDRGFCKSNEQYVSSLDYEQDFLQYEKIHGFGYRLL
jgi:hypothetical protein